MYEFKLPDLGEGIHEGEILKWYVAEGEPIGEDAPLVEVETDKAAVTIPSPKGGILARAGGKVGDIVEVGRVIAVIAAEGEEIGAATGGEALREGAAAAETGAAASAPPAPDTLRAPAMPAVPAEAAAPHATPLPASVSPPMIPAQGVATGRPVPAAPATRRLARELGVDLKQVTATGPGGRVMPEDVHRFAAAGEAATGGAPAETAPERTATAPGTGPQAAPGHGEAEAAGATAQGDASASEPLAEAEYAAHAASAIPFLDLEPLPDFSQYGPVEIEPLRSIRRKVAHKMVTSMILVPHVAHMDEADVTELEEFRKREKERRAGEPGGKLTLLPFIVKAVTAGLKEAKAFNASLDPFREQIVYKRHYHIGVAVDTGRGLVVPVVRDTDRKSIVKISAEIEDLAGRARTGDLEVSEMRGGTFTITNVGPLGGTALIPTINYPEVAILGMGRVQEKPVVRNGEIVIRKVLPLTLAFDHRIADGADAARFVTEMIRQLSDPNLLLLEA